MRIIKTPSVDGWKYEFTPDPGLIYTPATREQWDKSYTYSLRNDPVCEKDGCRGVIESSKPTVGVFNPSGANIGKVVIILKRCNTCYTGMFRATPDEKKMYFTTTVPGDPQS